MIEHAGAQGRFSFVCFDALGRLRWREEFSNLVVTQGKNLNLDTFFAGAAYTVTGPYMGLISSQSFSAIIASDTMASHPGWTEAGVTHTPHYSGTRATCTWAAAASGAKSLLSSAVFTFTGAGTIEGGFICLGTGAVATIDSTAGSLWSAGIFTEGAQGINIGDVVNVNYTTSL